MSSTEPTVLGRFVPGLAALLRYRRLDLRHDVVAGLSVAAVALPVGIAYAEIARVPAVIGIYSAIFPLFAYALFGSSRQLMTGPDAATCIMAAAAVGAIAGGDAERYVGLMVVLTLMTGLFYVAAGAVRLGFIANFLSQPILVGYLNGVALIILIGQLPKLCGFGSEASGFFPKVAEFLSRLDATHGPTLGVGLALLALLIVLRWLAPKLPGALIAAAVGIVAVAALGLQDLGVAVLGTVPSELPTLRLPTLDHQELKRLIPDAGVLVLISFTGGVLTAKSFARRNRYDISADQELVAYGACNLASGLAGGFPVTGTDSRTAVNDAAGGRTQLVGIIAGAAMLAFLLVLTGPLALLPKAALAAIIIVSASSLFDFGALRGLQMASGRELAFSLVTTAGVLVFGVLPGVLVVVVLSLLWLLANGSRPHDAVLGRVPGVKGYHDLTDYPEARTIPGLLLYRFDSDIVFFNCDYFRERILKEIAEAESPVEWVVVDASPVNVVDYTALQRIAELREDLAARGIVFAAANVKHVLGSFFRPDWVSQMQARLDRPPFQTVGSAVDAFQNRHRTADPSGPA
jgi:high affinity sulfate transporter 1